MPINKSLHVKHAAKLGGAIFALGLSISITVSILVDRNNQDIIISSLKNLSQQVINNITDRFVLYQYGLKSARAPIITAGETAITRKVFNHYSLTRDVDEEFPGARGFGFIRRVPLAQEADFILNAKQDSWPDFAIRQLNPHNGERYVIQYIEPVERNLAAVGLDIASESNRQQAAQAAMLTGETRLSGPITLVQATGSPLQSFLILMPIYRTGVTPASMEERNAQAFGWSYAALVTNEVLADLELSQALTKLTLTDVTDRHQPVHFYETHLNDQTRLTDYNITVNRDVFGRQWQIALSAYPQFIKSLNLTSASFVFIYSLLLSMLLAGVVALFGFNQQRKQLLVADNARRANILEHSLDAIISFDLDGLISSWNLGAETIFGYTEPEVIGHSSQALIVPEHLHLEEAEHFKQVSKGIPLLNHMGQHQDKFERSLSTSMTSLPIYDEFGHIIGVSQTIRDISVQLDAQRQILELNASLELKVSRRTQALEHALAENKTLLDTINKQLLYSETDRQGVILAVNDNFCIATGYSREQLVGKSHTLVKSGEHPKDFWTSMWQRLLVGESWHGEICNRNSNGELRWFDTVIGPIFDDKRQIERFVALRTDITDKKKAQLEKNKLAALLSSVLNAASEISIIATDETGIVSIFNRGAQLLLGYKENEVVGKVSPGIFHLESEVKQRASQLNRDEGLNVSGFEVFVYKARTYGPETSNWTYVRKDGSLCRVSLSVSAIRDEQDVITGYLGVAIDVELLLHQQEALISASTQLSKAAEVAELGIWTLDLQTKTEEWNDRMFTMYDQPKSLREEGLTYEHWLMRMHPEDVEMAEESLNKAIEGHAIYEPIFRIITSAGVRYIQAWAQISYDNQGNAIKVVGINRDITEQRELEHTLRQAKASADADSAAKSAFLANMSHEIRTPMNAVLGMLQLVQHTEMTAQQLDYVTKTEVAAKSLLGLLNDILDFSKIDANKLELDLHPCSFEAIMRELSVLLAANLQHKPVEVIFDIDPNMPILLLGDQQRIKQVLLNLAGNALKFTEQGHVVVSIKCVSQCKGSVTLEISVTDSGIGISQAQQGKIFQGFVQAESSTSRRFGGTGLGLAITKRLVELMGSELRVNSELGEGSRFSFELALEVVSDKTMAQAMDLSNKRLLLVDDSAMSRKILAKTLSSHGAQVSEASSGKEALSIIERDSEADLSFDLILMDWRMPDLSGLATAELIISQFDATQPPAIIMLTAYGEEMFLEGKSYVKQPFVSLLTKPVTANLILETVDNIISSYVDYDNMQMPLASKQQQGALLKDVSVLVVEDNQLNRQIIDELLRLQGARVTLAHGGLEGVAQVVESGLHFDIVIMDMQMPDMDGLEATQLIRQDPRFDTLPILAMTANASALDRELCLAAGMNEHVGKPIDLALVLPKMLGLLGREIPALYKGSTQAHRAQLHAEVDIEQVAILEHTESILRRFGGEMAFFVDVKESFISEMAIQLTQLETTIANKDLVNLGLIAHTIKGTASNIGAKRLSHFAAQLETHCQGTAPLDGAAWWLEKMQNYVAQSVEKLEQLFPSVSPEDLPLPSPKHLIPETEIMGSLLTLDKLLAEQNLDALSNMQELLAKVQLSDLWLTLNAQVNDLAFADALQTTKKIKKDLTTCS
ncbi:PAS domain S-box protein [Shewanella sp. SR44-3]|uniref:PAS domain S-box protein n=1 Tax=Shewanella sp. SR44-3 TaxID=2760936 RepID=UPI0015FCBA7A|nr:PAS domain S-box protein [Shewanella sp. SR44-3]MBB1267866.1 PAS domain S-box protein [Shewanella sp. SR44-3]